MDDAPTWEPPPQGTGPGGLPPGAGLEVCYRHPSEVTGVHCTRCGRPICPDCMRPAAVGYQCPDCLAAAGGSSRHRARLTVHRQGRLTRAIIGLNVAMFAVEVLVGGPGMLFAPNTLKLYNLGALYPWAVAAGQWWRLITAMFLHAGVLHIALNMWALWLFGTLIEEAFGPVRFLTIYFVSGFLGSVSSYLFSNPNVVAVGASGAIFGLLGAWIAYNFRRRSTAFGAMNLRSAITIVALNLVLGFSIAGIDIFAHLGGLIGGAVAGVLADGFGTRRTRTRVAVAGMAALVVLGVVLVVYRTGVLVPQIAPFG